MEQVQSITPEQAAGGLAGTWPTNPYVEYVLNVPPYTRYSSNGANLLVGGGGGGTGTVTSVTLTQPAAGITLTNSGASQTTAATSTLSLANDLAAVEGLATTGLVRRTAADTWSAGTAVSLTAEVSGLLPVANGGTGTATPGMTAGTNITLTGTWPNQTINATAGSGGDMVLATAQTVTGAKTFNAATLKLAGSTSGALTFAAPAAAGAGTVTLPLTGTLATLDGIETLTNKTIASPTITGPIAHSGADIIAGTAVAGNAIDFTVGRNEQSIATATTVTFTGSPVTGQSTTWLLTCDATARVVTLPANVRSQARQAVIGSFTLPANWTVRMLLVKTAAGYDLIGEPPPQPVSLTGAYTLTAADDGKEYTCTTALTVTVPTGLSPMPSVIINPPDTGNLSIAFTGGALGNGATTTLTRTFAANPVGVNIKARVTANAYGVSGS